MRRILSFFPALLATGAFCAPATLRHLGIRDDTDPWDLSSINKIAAIGDSYSAGIGAGVRLGQPYIIDQWGDWGCSRHDQSYPAVVNKWLYGSNWDHFQFHSCSGAVLKEIVDDQIPRLKNDQDIILMSGGGNDAELVDILNHCVFQWLAPTQSTHDAITEAAASIQVKNRYGQVIKGAFLAWWMAKKEEMTRSCDKQLEISEVILKGGEFYDRIGTVIDKAKEKLKKDSGAIYYTGYAKFWDPDMSDNDYCSSHSWSFFYNVDDPTHIVSDKAYLTKAKRQKMNYLVELANQKIKEQIEAKVKINSKGQPDIIFVDYDQYFGDIGGRFCNKGFDKPENERQGDLAFYPLNWIDGMGSEDFKRDTAVDVFNGTFEHDIDMMAIAAAASGAHYGSGVAKLKTRSLSSGTRELRSFQKRQENDLEKRASVLPDGYGRVFHPTTAGHSLIANLILWKVAERNAQGIQEDFADEIYEMHQNDTCPVNMNPDIGMAKCLSDEDSQPSKLPANVFYLANKNEGVFDGFCKEMDEDKIDDRSPQIWIVNTKGERQNNQSKHKRAPPPNPSAHKELIHLIWTPNKGDHNCRKSCHDAFSSIAQSCGRQGGNQATMATTSRYNIGCGTFTAKIVGNDVPEAPPAKCRDSKIRAPKGLQGPGVGETVRQFCKDNNGKSLEHHEAYRVIGKRYPISIWGVENRASFWISAQYNPGCSKKVTIAEYTCQNRFEEALKYCDKDLGDTSGFVASDECISYNVETSFATQDGMAPWDPINPVYAPPEDQDGLTVFHAKNTPTRGVSNSDLNKAIDSFCKSGVQIYGMGSKEQYRLDYPPANEPQFYPYMSPSLSFHMAAVTAVTGENAYKDPKWCTGFDGKMVQDDCTYAMRKVYYETQVPNGGAQPFEGGWFKYRCVEYSIWGVNNVRDPSHSRPDKPGA